jgi:hypothetical protein
MALVKLQRMSLRNIFSLTVACVLTCLWAVGCASVRADETTVQNAMFVSYAPNEHFGSLTVQEGATLRTFALSPNVVVQEREGNAPAKTILAAELESGEPVTLYLTPQGIVSQIDAAYQIVYARFITANNDSVITTGGAVYKLVGNATNSAVSLDLGTFLRLKVNPAANTAFELAASKQPFAGAPVAAPVTVTFNVTVPSNTPPSDIVYLTGDAQNWVPNAVRMTPVSAHLWTATLTLGQGSSLKYKYTRGSWQTVETNQAGIEIPNRSLVVTKSGTSQAIDDTVLRWSDLPS